MWWRSAVNLSFFLSLATFRMRSSACSTLTRFCARHVLCWSAFPLVHALGSTGSAALAPADASTVGCSALFAGYNGRPAAQSAWAKSIEKVNNKQAELKQRAATTTEWGSVIEKLSIRLKQQAVAARAEASARTVEKLSSRHTGLP